MARTQPHQAMRHLGWLGASPGPPEHGATPSGGSAPPIDRTVAVHARNDHGLYILFSC